MKDCRTSNTSLGLLVQWTIRLCQYVGLDSGCTEHCDPHKSLNKLLFIYVCAVLHCSIVSHTAVGYTKTNEPSVKLTCDEPLEI